MINASTPPVPAPRTKILQRMNSSSNAGNSSSTSCTGSRKAKSSHPWMTLVHSGPWTQLPPAPAPVTPASSWFKPRALPPNPFGEVVDEDNQDDTREEPTKTESANQTKPSEANIPSINAVNQLNKSPDAPAPVSLSDTGNTTSDRKTASAEKPIPAKRQGSKGTQPPTSDSTQKDESTGSSSSSSIGRTADNANWAANTVSSTEVKPGVFHFAGTVSGEPELEGVASGLVLPGKGEPSLGGVVDFEPGLEEVTSGIQVPDLGGLSNKLGVSDLAGAGSGVIGNVCIPDRADVSGALGAPDLAGAVNPFGVPDVPDLAGVTAGHGKPDLKGLSGLEVPDMAGATDGLSKSDLKGLSGLEVPDLAGATAGLCKPDLAEAGALSGAVGAAESPVASDEAKTLPLTKSVSVPAIFSTLPQSPSTTASLSKACKENPFDRKLGIPKSKTAPGYGFPLIKRKVQTDCVVPVEDLEVEMGELDKQVFTLDLKGMELEKSLRNCQNDEDEEKMLMDWLTLIREKQVLVRRDAELVYLTKQQHLEERQTDVEYELRCLLNKPEGGWSQEDRGREQQLMDELVTIIEQRNQIISSLDQDRQREREEDLLLETMMKRKDFQKEGIKELKKSRGKFKLMKVLKMLSQKSETAKDSKDKKKS